MTKNKTRLQANRVRFFETFFTAEELDQPFAEKRVNGWWLIRHWDGNAQKMTVDLFSEEAFRNYDRRRNGEREDQQRLDFVASL